MANRRTVTALLAGLFIAVGPSTVTHARGTDQSATAGGVTVYLGVVPAEIVKGLAAGGTTERPMHGHIPKGAHEYHVMAAVFDATTGERVSDAKVTAQISGLGLSGSSKPLEPMQIAGTTTYGAFFDLPGFDIYAVKLTVERGGAKPVTLDFKYDHHR